MTAAATDKAKSIPKVSLFGGGALLVALYLPLFFSLPRVLFKESDIFWMLATGRLILQNHALPSADPFSATIGVLHWIVYQWLSDLIFTLVSVLGFKGEACFGAALIALIFSVMILRRSLRAGARPLMIVVATWSACAALYPDFATLRPQLFSYIFLFLLQSIAEDCWAQPKSIKDAKSMIVKTALIGIGWANCHVSFPLGVMLLAIYLGFAIAQQIYKHEKDRTRPVLFGCLMVTFVCSTLINPYFTGLWFFIPRLQNMYVTQEMMPLFEFNHWLWFTALLTVGLLISNRVALPRVFWAVVLFVLGVMHTHFMTYFCLSTLPLVSESLSWLASPLYEIDWLSRLDECIGRAAQTPLYPPAVITAAVLVVACGPLLIPTDVPVAAAEYFDEHVASIGNLFNSQSAGNYLINRYNGRVKVFMDTRFDLYDRRFCEAYFAALQGSRWRELFEAWGIKTTLLPNHMPLNVELSHDPNWKLIYKDDYFSIYQRAVVHS